MRWKYHREFSEVICGGYHKGVDAIVDSGVVKRRRRKSVEEAAKRYLRGITEGASANVEIPPVGSHDDVKMNFCAFMNTAREVYEKYGEEGLCQLILHIILDKANSAFRGAVVAVAWRDPSLLNKDEICSRTYNYLLSDISILTIIRYWDEISRDPTNSVENILNSLVSLSHYKPSKPTIRKKKSLLERLISDVLARKSECLDEEILELSRKTYQNIIREISKPQIWEQICCTAAKHSRDPDLPRIIGCSQ
jgi:hypothetical protein